MKSLITDMIRSSRQIGANFGKAYSRRRDLSLRGEEKVQYSDRTSTMAEHLQVLEQQVTRAPVMDFQRRNSIRNAIATGAYIIDPISIATKLIRFEKRMYR